MITRDDVLTDQDDIRLAIVYARRQVGPDHAHPAGALRERICRLRAEGLSVRAIAREADMPSRSTVGKIVKDLERIRT